MTTIHLHRGTTARYLANDPVLADGEPALEYQTDPSLPPRVKYGNGVSHWSDLPYADDGSTGGLVTSVAGRVGDVILTTADIGGLGSAATHASTEFDAAGAAAAAQAASQPVDSDLTAIALLTTTTFGRGLLTLADAGATRTLLGLGTAALAATGDFDLAGAAAAAAAASVAKAGSTMTGALTLSGDPATSLQAATKQYVDAHAAGFTVHSSCIAATTGALPACTYANGAGGVGATLTGNANGVLPTQDGITLTVGQRLLVKDQAAGLQNGAYAVTQVGDGSHPFILTRVADADDTTELAAGAFFLVTSGTTVGGSSWVQTVASPTIGTTALAFGQVTGPTTLTAGTAITVVGSTISVSTGGVTDVQIAGANKDGVAGTASMRTLGTGAQQATAGNDARLSDARVPTGHHTSHELGGTDVLTLDLSQITGLTAALAGLQPADSDLTAIAALTTTSFGRSLLTAADAAALRAAAGLGTAATHDVGDFDAAGAAAAAQAASQPVDSDLTAIAAVSTAPYGRGLLALADAAALRTSAGLGSAATHPATDFDAAGAAAAAAAASQPVDSDLTAIAALSTTTFGRSVLTLADAAALRTAAALGTAATHDLVGDLDARYLAGVTSATKGSPNLVPAITFDSLGRISTVSENPIVIPRFGGLRTFTHSYGSFNGRASLAGNSSNFIRRVAAAMNIPVNEVDFWFHSGLMAGFPNIGDTTGNCGIGGIFRHSYPLHLYSQSGSTQPTATSKANPYLDLIDVGINDVFGAVFATTTMAQNAATNGIRAAMTRLRAGRLYACDDAACAYSGTWTQLTDKNYVSFGKYKSTATLGDTLTFTIPVSYTGGPIAITLLGNPNFRTTLHTALTDTTGTTVTIEENANAPQSGSYVILVGTEQILIPTATSGSGNKTFTGCTRGYNGTTAATHTVNSLITRPTTITYLDFSASTANLDGAGAGVAPVSVRGFDASGHLPIAGQGTSGAPGGAVPGTDIQMVARFTGLTATDAGKTIVAKFKWSGSAHADGDVLTNQFFRPFDVVIEDVDPPTQLVVNQPACLQAGKANVDFKLNPALLSIVGEFTNAYLVDVETLFDNLFGATIQTATGTGESSITITPRNAALNVIAKGSVLRSELESFLVTSDVTKTDSTHWTMNVTTNYTGLDAPAGVVTSSGNVNHAVGAEIIDVRAWALIDGLHQADIGHLLFAAQVIATLGTVSSTSANIAASGGYKAHDNQGWVAPASGVPGYLVRQSNGGARGTMTIVEDTEYAEPFWIPQNGLLVEFASFVVTGGAAGAKLRWGLYADEKGCPGALIYDSGQIAATSNAVLATTGAVVLPVTRGWYWRSVVGQNAGTGVPTVRGLATIIQPVANYFIPDTAANILLTHAVAGLTRTGMTGALTDWDSTVQGLALDNATWPFMINGYEVFVTG